MKLKLLSSLELAHNLGLLRLGLSEHARVRAILGAASKTGHEVIGWCSAEVEKRAVEL